MPIKNYTTKIAASKTVSEIQYLLVTVGAKRIAVDYNDEGEPISISFSLMASDNPMYFSLSANWQEVLRYLQKEGKVAKNLQTPEHAVRVAWRTLQDFIEAQVAFIQAGMATAEEVFIGNVCLKDGRPLVEHITGSSSGIALLSNKNKLYSAYKIPNC